MGGVVISNSMSYIYSFSHICGLPVLSSHFAMLGFLPRLFLLPLLFPPDPTLVQITLYCSSCQPFGPHGPLVGDHCFIIQSHSTWYSLPPLLDSKAPESKLLIRFIVYLVQCLTQSKHSGVCRRNDCLSYLSAMGSVQQGHKVSVQLSQGRSRDGIPGKGTFELLKG